MTNMSPLQYQKQLRLLKPDGCYCRRCDASTAAIKAKGESVSQFHQEYKRQFGITPIGDKVPCRWRPGPGAPTKASSADSGSPMSAVLIRPTARPYQSRNGTSPSPVPCVQTPPVNLLDFGMIRTPGKTLLRRNSAFRFGAMPPEGEPVPAAGPG